MNATHNIGPIAADITTAIGTTKAIPYGDCNQGQVYVPSGSAITSLTWHVCYAEGGTYVAAYDNGTPSAVVQTVAAGQGHPIPAALAGARWLKAVGDEAGTIYLTMKS
jgi:hypothetical protein